MSKFYKVGTTVSAAVASGSTITFSYPAGTDAGHFENTNGHKLWVAGHQYLYAYIDDFTISFGTSSITVTYNGSTSIPAGSDVSLQLNEIDYVDDRDVNQRKLQGVIPTGIYILDLGAPDVADANGVAESQSVGEDEEFSLDGALVSGGEAVFDAPRNVVAAWTTSAKITVTGEDEYGNTVVETTGSAGTSHAGKKAFKKVTSVTSDTAITGATVGTGDVLGLPVRLPDAGYAFVELEDGEAATAGTVVGADDSEATATTGDVRGTYDPNSAMDGSTAIKLIAAIPDPTDKGVSQFAG